MPSPVRKIKASQRMRWGRARTAAGAVAMIVAGALAASGSARSTSSGAIFVPAARERLTTSPHSPVAHDTETEALVVHAGRLFAATGQWEYAGPSAYGQVLVKDSAGGAWKVFERTQVLRVEALDSFAIPKDQGLGTGHSLLVTEAIVDGHARIQWLLDGAKSFEARNSYLLASNGADVRAFGAHESNGVWSVYAGVNPTGILRGTWSKQTHTLVFDPKPELTPAPPGSPGLKTQKVTGFADCAGALYVTINTKLYRRNDGPLPHGVPRWVLVYQEAPVGPFNSGLRGITCVAHDRLPALLISTEGDGDVYRFDHLPHGEFDTSQSAAPGDGLPGFTPTLEFSPVRAVRKLLAAQGTTTPAAGHGSVGYVIAAYNNGDFMTVKVGNVERQVFGFEWGYEARCAATRVCGPTAFGGIHFDAAACFAIRTDHGSSQSYQLRCLGGPKFKRSGKPGDPIRPGQAFVSIRTTQLSPFQNGLLYYGGYDCNFYPADGTAWIATSAVSALHP